MANGPVAVATPGFYSYRESIAAGGFVRPAQTKCAEVAETTVVVSTPEVRTRISDTSVRPGAKITDKVVVSGLGALEVTVKGSTIKVELNGTVILDADLAEVKEFMHNSPHPGKDRTSGYFGFAGHNDPVAFRNIQIKSLEPKELKP